MATNAYTTFEPKDQTDDPPDITKTADTYVIKGPPSYF